MVIPDFIKSLFITSLAMLALFLWMEYEHKRILHKEVSTVCIDGVEYFIIDEGTKGYMSPHTKKDGGVYICK